MRLDEKGLERWGERIGRTVSAPVVIALQGPLGAGKSVLARAIGGGAGVEEAMPSPTYNLLLRYDTDSGVAVVHVDLYRIDSTDELWELGWSELGLGQEIVVVEWPERAGDLMPEDHWLVKLSAPSDAPELRDVEVHRIGDPPELPAFPMSVSATAP
ncbi:MAG: tRNA (adenosine(37)-N6)-threonylcarbamoyltransferase complex ATPase subunit type 1 TsaE [Longimicrobiales bacterium]|nr:tRNA (adenosine(37)-N6)-threonylcarbamoyltransferase complex ATPase subunit type 1 TsaE [Longimicrobiales bacterium]